mgnify:CR=1 FL=1
MYTDPFHIFNIEISPAATVEPHHVSLEEDHEVMIRMEDCFQTLMTLLKFLHIEVVQQCHLLSQFCFPLVKLPWFHSGPTL